MADESQGREITLDQMMALRGPTESISAWLRSELEDRLETLRLLLSPRRFLGQHLKTARGEDIKGADKLYEELAQTYKESAGDPLKLPTRLGDPLDPISADLALHPWEYTHEATDGPDKRRITIKSPVSWVLTYASPLSLSQVRMMVAGEAPRDDAQMKQFAVNSCLMKLTMKRSTGIMRLLEALRLKIDFTSSPDTGKLPLLRLASGVPAFRPADGIILNAARLSGVSTFEELVDVEAAGSLEDPLRAKVAALAGGGS